MAAKGKLGQPSASAASREALTEMQGKGDGCVPGVSGQLRPGRVSSPRAAARAADAARPAPTPAKGLKAMQTAVKKGGG